MTSRPSAMVLQILHFVGIIAAARAAAPTLWPQPLSAQKGSALAVVSPGASFFKVSSGTSKLLEAAFERYAELSFPHEGASSADKAITGLELVVADHDESHPQLGTDESYKLIVPESGVAQVSAKTVYGALRGLETFSQLVGFNFDTNAYEIQNAPWQIVDEPRFPHRGLMIDTGRHFESLASIRAIIDSLPYAKLNVLHWHMVDLQSFPFQSKSAPKLWEAAYSENERYTQQDVASIVEYARLRGVRVMVEFDMPGHASSWCTGYPEICPSATCKAPLNVASNATFNLIDGLIDEIAGSEDPLFKDSFVHLGGDEVDTSCWGKTPSVSQWLRSRNMTPDDGYAYFAKRVAAMVIKRKHRPVQWSEVFDHFKSELPKETVVHVWKGNTNITEVVALGYDVIKNVGYFNESWYLDNLNVKWDAVYQNEPCEGVPTDSLCKKVLGGHGEMWGETVDGSDLEQTVWPRLAAIAEKLWSSRSATQDAAAAHDRISNFRCLLLERGVAAAPVDNANARQPPSGPGSCYPKSGKHVAKAYQTVII